MPTSRPLAPKGGNDKVYTPDLLAAAIVNHFLPPSRKDSPLFILEPCAGRNAFTRQFKLREWDECEEFELDRGTDFLGPWHHTTSFDGFDWIITNPPWSQFRAFLNKSMEVADNVVFLALFNAWFMKARVRDVKEAGFGYKMALFIDTPPPPWPQTGFQLAAVHIQRGYTGSLHISDL